jgi:hypothetical protein
MHTSTHAAFFCPFDAPLHEDVERVELDTRDWARRHDLLAPRSDAGYTSSRFAWLAARTFGYASLADLRLANDLCVWLFVRDDHIDDMRHAERHERVLEGAGQRRALTDGPTPDGLPLERAIADIGARIRARGGSAWLDRFARHFESYLAATRWEHVNNRRALPPAVPSYRLLRRATGAVQLCFDLGAIFHDVSATSPWLEHPCVTALETLANDHVTWTNDVFGFDKERTEGNQNNIVSSLAHAGQLDLEDAKAAAIAACNEVVAAYLELESTLPSLGVASSETAAYRRAMTRWMRGNLDWYADTRRYDSGRGAAPRPAAPPLEASG